MKIDEAIQTIYKAQGSIKWEGFNPKWFDKFENEHECYDYYEYYYAEDEVYVIRDAIRGEMFFTKARSPYEAYMNHSRMCAEANGGIFRGRDYKLEDFVVDFCGECQCFDDCYRIPINKDSKVITDFRENCKDFEPVENDYFF